MRVQSVKPCDLKTDWRGLSVCAMVRTLFRPLPCLRRKNERVLVAEGHPVLPGWPSTESEVNTFSTIGKSRWKFFKIAGEFFLRDHSKIIGRTADSLVPFGCDRCRDHSVANYPLRPDSFSMRAEF